MAVTLLAILTASHAVRTPLAAVPALSLSQSARLDHALPPLLSPLWIGVTLIGIG